FNTDHAGGFGVHETQKGAGRMKKSNLLMALAVGLSANGLSWSLRDSARGYHYPLSRNRITGHRKLSRQAQKRRKAK
ncbi:hypothetical protein Q4R52_18210, partial [Morganella morganii]